METKHLEIVEAFPWLPDTAGISIPVWGILSGRSRASTYRDMAAGTIESFTIGRSRVLRVGSCRRLLTGGTG